MRNKKLKIFIGFTEIANFVNTYRQGFELLGHETLTLVSSRNKYYPDAHYDYVISEKLLTSDKLPNFLLRIVQSLQARLWSSFVFLKALFSCDIFYYNTGGNILPFALDYWLIRAFKKKLVVIYLGSEIRHWYLYKQEMESLGYADLFKECIETYRKQNFGTYRQKKRTVFLSEKFANLILSQPGFAQLQTKPYMRVTVGLNLENYKCSIHNRKVPIIVHAPSSRGVKGTEFVLEAVEQLKNDGFQFEFKLVENLPNSLLIELLEEVDIVVDELNSDSIGVLSAEAMATGNAVLTSYFEQYIGLPLPCPVLNTNKSNIYENLKMLIKNVELRVSLAERGRGYISQHQNIVKIVERELNFLFNVTEVKRFDFYPSFYKEAFIPQNVLDAERF